MVLQAWPQSRGTVETLKQSQLRLYRWDHKALLACCCTLCFIFPAWILPSSGPCTHLCCSAVIDYLYLQVGVASLIDPGSKIQVCKVDVSKRASCGDLLGNTLPCPVSPGYRGTIFPATRRTHSSAQPASAHCHMVSHRLAIIQMSEGTMLNVYPFQFLLLVYSIYSISCRLLINNPQLAYHCRSCKLHRSTGWHPERKFHHKLKLCGHHGRIKEWRFCRRCSLSTGRAPRPCTFTANSFQLHHRIHI